jgi:hypothetical protein
MARYPYDRVYDPDQLHGEIAALNLPGFLGIAGGAIGSTAFTVDFEGELSAGEKTTLDAAIAGHVPLSAIVKLRNQAKELIDAVGRLEVLMRAVILLTADEINLLRQRETDTRSALGAASTYAAYRTAVTSFSGMGQRTKSQILTGLRNKIDAGTADTST